MTESLQRCVRFARICKEYNIDPKDLADMTHAAECASRAFAYNDNQAYARHQNKIETIAEKIGITTEYYGVLPTLRIKVNDTLVDVELPTDLSRLK